VSNQQTDLTTEIPESLRVPLGWRQPGVTLTKGDIFAVTYRLAGRITLSLTERSKCDELIGGSLLSVQQSEAFASALSICDHVAKSTTFNNKFTEFLSKSRVNYSSRSSKNEHFVIEQLGWRGYTMIHGYHAYQNPSLILRAISYWNELEYRTVPKNAVNYGGYRIFAGTSGRPVYIGYVAMSNWDHLLNQSDTLLKLTLSAHLAEKTKLDKYKESACSAVESIKSITLDPTTMLVKHGDLYVSTSSTQVQSFEPSCHMTGLLIEGLSVLASVTEDESLINLMIHVATSAINAPQWHGSDGILKVGSDGDVSTYNDDHAFKGFLLRGLLEAYRRTPTNTAFRTLIRSYINVQFNALRELAREGDDYGVDWRGPFKGPFLHGQLAAFDALVATIGVQES
ncbi:hypothetical protein FRC02_001956, partial [Tulasnella sp. 418]